MPMAWANGARGPRRSRGRLCHGMTRTQEPREAPRVRDLPAPRRAQGFIAPLFRQVFAWPYRAALAGLYRAGFRRLAGHAPVPGRPTCGVGWLLLRAAVSSSRDAAPWRPAVLDIFDGGVARLRGEAGPAGAFLDSVMDRVSDFVLFACLYWSLAGQRTRWRPLPGPGPAWWSRCRSATSGPRPRRSGCP